MSENFCLETEFADRLAIAAGLLGSSRGGKFDILDTKIIKSFSDLNFLGGIKECVRKLLAFSLKSISCVQRRKLATKVDSMMEKFDTRDKKSSARGRIRQLYSIMEILSYGLLFGVNLG